MRSAGREEVVLNLVYLIVVVDNNEVLVRNVMNGLSQSKTLHGERKDIALLNDYWLILGERAELLLEKSVLSTGIVLYKKLLGVVLLSSTVELCHSQFLVRKTS